MVLRVQPAPEAERQGCGGKDLQEDRRAGHRTSVRIACLRHRHVEVQGNPDDQQRRQAKREAQAETEPEA